MVWVQATFAQLIAFIVWGFSGWRQSRSYCVGPTRGAGFGVVRVVRLAHKLKRVADLHFTNDLKTVPARETCDAAAKILN
jgi:hypothetical protein